MVRFIVNIPSRGKKRCGKNKRGWDEIRHDRGKDGVISVAGQAGRGAGAAPRGLCVFGARSGAPARAAQHNVPTY